MKSGDVIELEIEDLAFGGDGVARYEGQVVFVPFTTKGDRIKARIVKKATQFARAEMVSLLEPGAGRCVPSCTYFGNCGGCQYQHIDYATQLVIKEKQLRDVLARIGGLTEVELKPWLASPQAYGYRNRISVHHEGAVIGFRGLDGRRLIDIKECPLASVEVNDKLKYLRAHPGKREHYSLREDNIPAEGFYQANGFLLEKFRALVAEYCLVDQPEWIIECYGGAGFFTEALAAGGEQRISMIESDTRLVEVARKKLALKSVGCLNQKVSILSGECEEFLPDLMKDDDFAQVKILLDPPREGLSSSMRDLLRDCSARSLVYVSCNPATLARDLKDLSAYWTPIFFQPIDLFPQTAHFECISVCQSNRI